MSPDEGALRQSLAERGAWVNVKPMPNRRNVPLFSLFLYRYRNLVERFFNKLKHFRAVATRYDKRADNALAGPKLASARIWMRFNEPVATSPAAQPPSAVILAGNVFHIRWPASLADPLKTVP